MGRWGKWNLGEMGINNGWRRGWRRGLAKGRANVRRIYYVFTSLGRMVFLRYIRRLSPRFSGEDATSSPLLSFSSHSIRNSLATSDPPWMKSSPWLYYYRGSKMESGISIKRTSILFLLIGHSSTRKI